MLHRSISLAVVRARLALAGGREDTSAGGFWAGNTQHVDVHQVVSEERVSQGGVTVGGRRERERRMLVWHWHVPQLGFGFKLRKEAVGRGRCSSQKGSGAEAVCHEWPTQAPSSLGRAAISGMLFPSRVLNRYNDGGKNQYLYPPPGA